MVPSNHTRIGAWINSKIVGEKSTSILYNSINRHAGISHKKNRRYGKLGLQLIFQSYLPGGGLPVVMMAGDPRGSRLLHWARPWSTTIPGELHSCCLYRIIFHAERNINWSMLIQRQHPLLELP